MERQKKSIIIMFLFLIGLMTVNHSTSVPASNWDYEATNESISGGSWYKWSGTMSEGLEISGFFETSEPTDGIDFLICDESNYNLYSAGNSANVFSLKENMHYAGFTFTIPNTDTWYVVFSNRDGIYSVTVDMALDTGSDNSPNFSSLLWDSVVYAEVLENDQWYYFSLYCVEGIIIDVSFATWFSTDGVDGFICDSSNYDLWSTGQTATVWNEKKDMHTATLTSFSTTHDDTWYVVFSAVGEVDTVTISAGVDFGGSSTSGTSTATTTIPSSTTLSTTTILTTTTTTNTSESIDTSTSNNSSTTTTTAPSLTSLEFLMVPLGLVLSTLIHIRRKKKRK